MLNCINILQAGSTLDKTNDLNIDMIETTINMTHNKSCLKSTSHIRMQTISVDDVSKISSDLTTNTHESFEASLFERSGNDSDYLRYQLDASNLEKTLPLKEDKKHYGYKKKNRFGVERKKTSEINKINLSKFSLINNHLKTRKTHDERRNEILELDYPRDSMSIELTGPFLSNFNMTIEAINAELYRCVKVKRVQEALITESELDDKKVLKITTCSYKDFMKLINKQNWPTTAFKTGIKLQICATKLYVNILGVETKTRIENNVNTWADLEKNTEC